MWKNLLIFILILAGLYLSAQGVWMMHISAFGFEISISALLVIGLLILIFYVLYLLKKPWHWIQNYRAKQTLKNAHQKTNFWQLILTTVLDQDNTNQARILKLKKTFCPKDTLDPLLVEALFHPTRDVFEELLKYPQTKLAGLRGLIQEAQVQGDFVVQEKLLTQAATEYSDVSWVFSELYNLQVLQNKPDEALKTLNLLLKRKWISNESYHQKKAEILFQLKQYKEAFALMPDNPMMALAYAQSEPKKAPDILSKSWALTPDWDVYEAYQKAIASMPLKKQGKLIEKFLFSNQAGGIYLIALADYSVKTGEWAKAKENLDVYLNAYPLTRQVALMMSKIEGDGYHHADKAKEWLDKAESL